MFLDLYGLSKLLAGEACLKPPLNLGLAFPACFTDCAMSLTPITSNLNGLYYQQVNLMFNSIKMAKATN
jgi:hypothetical protein